MEKKQNIVLRAKEMRNYEQKVEINWFIFALMLPLLHHLCHTVFLSFPSSSLQQKNGSIQCIRLLFSLDIERALHFFPSLFVILCAILFFTLRFWIFKSFWSCKRTLAYHSPNKMQSTNKQTTKHVTTTHACTQNNAFICVSYNGRVYVCVCVCQE